MMVKIVMVVLMVVVVVMVMVVMMVWLSGEEHACNAGDAAGDMG